MIRRPPSSTLFPYTPLFRSGKTPTTVNLAFALARAGYQVLLVDFDPQGSLSEYFLADQADLQDVTVYNALSDLQRIEPLTIAPDRKSTRLNSSHANISYAVF